MRYKVIACRVFAREISMLSARSAVVLDVTWIRQGLHNYPSLLRDAIQKEIDRAEAPWEDRTSATRPPEEYAGIILGFGLCSRATVGLQTTRLPLIVPQSHDCIGLLLGSKRRYRKELRRAPGTYWFSPGWIEEASFPSGDQYHLIRDRFSRLYGEDNGEYLVNLERESLSAYSRAVLIRWPELDREDYRQRVSEIAEDLGWRVETVDGDTGWMARILEGRWNEDDVAVSRPGETLEHLSDGEERVFRVVAEEAQSDAKARTERHA
jgi:hypothetical protein